MKNTTMYERRQRIFDKCYDTFEAGKDAPAFWNWAVMELKKCDFNGQQKNTLAKASMRKVGSPGEIGRLRDFDFNNVVSEDEIQSLIALAEV